jgi:hypothetical protein
MKMKGIKFQIDSGISIFFKKSGEMETKNLTPDHVRYAIANYDISLIKNPIKRVKEQYKLNKRNIEFQQDNFVLFFPLDNIIKPNESQITFRSIVFYLQDGQKFSFKLNKTYTFIELQKNNNSKIVHAPSHGKIHTKATKSLQEGESPSQTSPNGNKNSTLTKREGGNTLFVDSFQKFKESMKESDLLNLFEKKEKSLNFNLKSFGISLLCKLLLLTKYLNNLVDNEFQADLQKFIKVNLLETGVSP